MVGALCEGCDFPTCCLCAAVESGADEEEEEDAVRPPDPETALLLPLLPVDAADVLPKLNSFGLCGVATMASVPTSGRGRCSMKKSATACGDITRSLTTLFWL